MCVHEKVGKKKGGGGGGGGVGINYPLKRPKVHLSVSSSLAWLMNRSSVGWSQQRGERLFKSQSVNQSLLELSKQLNYPSAEVIIERRFEINLNHKLYSHLPPPPPPPPTLTRLDWLNHRFP